MPTDMLWSIRDGGESSRIDLSILDQGNEFESLSLKRRLSLGAPQYRSRRHLMDIQTRRKKAMARPIPDPSQFATWEAIRTAFPSIDEFATDSIYALPLGMIDAIESEMPNFFIDEELKFERHLTQVSGRGFFMRQPICCPHISGAAPSDTMEIELELDARRLEADQSIREMLSDEIRSRGGGEKEIDSYWGATRTAIQQNERWQKGYAGWLVTNSNFIRECGLFRARWQSRISELGRFPTIPMSYLGETPDPPRIEDRAFFAEYIDFYRRWGIETMASWDLPIPMRTEFAMPSLYSLDHLSGAGLVVFVPWHALRSKELDLHVLAEQMRVVHAPLHLRRWLDGEPKNWGYDRLGTILDLYVIIKLILERRYKPRLSGNFERLDRAFGCFFGQNPNDPNRPEKMAETIRKIRLEMNRRIQATA